MRKGITLIFIISLVLCQAQTDSTRYDNPDSLDIRANNIPTLSLNDLEGDTQGQDMSGLLQSSRDPFTNNAGYNFSAARFRVRGMNSNNFTVMLNGVQMNDPEIGWAIWANWGGLNDITRFPENGQGVSENDYHFGGVQGYSNIDLRASTKRAGQRISYSASNRSYRNRAMVTYNTGLNSKGFALSASMSGRWGDEGYVQGTSYSNLSYFLSLEKKVDDKHTFGLVGLGSPSVRGRSGIVTQETYDLRDDNFYNPYWGYQNGEKRNSRMRYSHKPIVMLWHDFSITPTSKLKTNIYSQFGQYSQTRLNFDDANDPRPEYYRNLPSWPIFNGEPELAPALADAWANDESFYQLQWDNFYDANRNNLFTVNDADGVLGLSVQGNRSKYILEEAHTDPNLLGANFNYVNELTDKNAVISSGLNIYRYSSENYKVVNDFLGGDFWLDVDRFNNVETETSGNNPLFGENGDPVDSDLNNPNNVILSGERFGYDYDINQSEVQFFTQWRQELSKVDYYAAVSAGTKSFWRDGKMRTALFPEDSFGESEKATFTTGGVKAGLDYKLSGRHFISANMAYMSRAPLTRNSFVSPRTRNTMVGDMVNEKISSVDLSYHLRFPNIKGRLTLYQAQIKDQASILTFFQEGSSTLVNFISTGIDHQYRGLELGLEGNVTQTVTLSAAIAQGQNIYTDRPKVTTVVDNDNSVLAKEEAFLENYRVGRSPQTAMNFGVNYRSPKFWFTGLNFSYFADNWLEPLGYRRTSTAVASLVNSDPQWNQMLAQQQLDNGGVLNFFAGKSWRIDYKYYFLITANVSNVLDKTDFRTGGFEQGRPTPQTLDLFPNRYGYMYGRTYFLMVRFSF
jgi:hypothetical protein